MNKKEVIDLLKSKCFENLKKYKSENNEEKFKLYATINKIIENEDCFKTMDIEVALNIFKDLDIEKKYALEYYNELIR